MTTICIEKSQLEGLLKIKPTNSLLETLENIVVLNDITDSDWDKAKEKGIKLYSYRDLVNAGKAYQ